MADISKMNVGGTEYNIKDETARNSKADKAKLISISFAVASWAEGDGIFTQTVTVSGGTANSLVALQPTAAQIVALQEAGVAALVVDNNSGTFTATAVGAAPTEAMTIQATLTEVSA